MVDGTQIPTGGEPDVGPGLSIRRVSDLLAVPAPTIRSWERRYGVCRASRSKGGHRRYLPSDLATLRLMRDQISRGHRAADAAAEVVAAASSTPPHQSLVEAFLDAAYHLEPDGARAALDRSQHELGLDQTLSDVLLPSMQQIGRWWESGRCDVAHEHLATEAALAWLHGRQVTPADRQPETVLLTCGPRDLHTLGLEALGVLLGSRGFGCRMLGARTPVTSLATAVTGTHAAVVVMVSHLAVARRSAVEAMRAADLAGARLFYAGNSFASSQSRRKVPGRYLGEHLTSAADMLTSDLMTQRGHERHR